MQPTEAMTSTAAGNGRRSALHPPPSTLHATLALTGNLAVAQAIRQINPHV
ncbi:MAG: hypothetical protein HY260_02150, partial [Chloroflexi bacterium]|nr:hypothetical protein [Chloroflexota bacterium]